MGNEKEKDKLDALIAERVDYRHTLLQRRDSLSKKIQEIGEEVDRLTKKRADLEALEADPQVVIS